MSRVSKLFSISTPHTDNCHHKNMKLAAILLLSIAGAMAAPIEDRDFWNGAQKWKRDDADAEKRDFWNGAQKWKREDAEERDFWNGAQKWKREPDEEERDFWNGAQKWKRADSHGSQ